MILIVRGWKLFKLYVDLSYYTLKYAFVREKLHTALMKESSKYAKLKNTDGPSHKCTQHEK